MMSCPASITDIAPTEPPQLSGNCPESKKEKTWIPFRGHCYSFLSSKVDNWAHASVECLKLGTFSNLFNCSVYVDALKCFNVVLELWPPGATLVSIQDPTEGQFIQKNLELLQDGAKTFWIGLYKTHEGERGFAILVTSNLTSTERTIIMRLSIVSNSKYN